MEHLVSISQLNVPIISESQFLEMLETGTV